MSYFVKWIAIRLNFAYISEICKGFVYINRGPTFRMACMFVVPLAKDPLPRSWQSCWHNALGASPLFSAGLEKPEQYQPVPAHWGQGRPAE